MEKLSRSPQSHLQRAVLEVWLEVVLWPVEEGGPVQLRAGRPSSSGSSSSSVVEGVAEAVQRVGESQQSAADRPVAGADDAAQNPPAPSSSSPTSSKQAAQLWSREGIGCPNEACL